MEGFGQNDSGKTTHDALGLLSYNPIKYKFIMTAHLASGLSTDANFEALEPNKKLKWWFDDGRGGTIKYFITNDGTNWKEEGEYYRDGNNWNKFFEMNLKKID